MSSLSVYIAPLLVFGLVVFVHELGHFMAAKLTGVYAPVFSLGWGRRLFGWRRGETDYRVSLIPLGGYVRMASRDDDALAGIEGGVADRGSLDTASAPPTNEPGSLWDAQAMAPFGPKPVPADRWVESKSTTARVFILSAGVLMNILLTLTVATGLSYKVGKAYVPAVIDSVLAGAPAATAGLTAGDRIVAINRQPIASWSDVLDAVSPVTSGSLSMEVARGGERIIREITPQVTDGVNPVTGAPMKVGRIGIAVRDSIVRVPLTAWQAVVSGKDLTIRQASNVFAVLSGLVRGQVSTKNLGGPIAIAKTSVQAARDGADTLWSLIAFLSINIAILNLVPIPVLDGGQILMVLAERVKGSAFSMRTREAFARVGVLAVLALIVLVTFNDLQPAFKYLGAVFTK
jgi:regulator of sigma E protease